jgi:hypothetical protein
MKIQGFPDGKVAVETLILEHDTYGAAHLVFLGGNVVASYDYFALLDGQERYEQVYGGGFPCAVGT